MVPTFSELLESLQPSSFTTQSQGKVVHGYVSWQQDIGEHKNLKVWISIYSICLTFFRVIISLQLSTLYRHNVPPSAISEVLKDIKGDDDGTYLPKTLFNANERSLDLLNLAEGILKDDSDAEKLMKVLDA